MDKENQGSKIDAKLIEEIVERLNTGKRVRRRLYPWGRINVDRQLPFICVYRKHGNHSAGDEKLVVGEASYLTTTSSEREYKNTSKLVSNLASTMASKFGAFLIIELWVKPFQITDDMPAAPPHIKVVQPPAPFPHVDTNSFAKSLKNIRIQKRHSKVEVVHGNPCPDEMKPFLNRAQCKKENIFMIGVEITDVYRDSVTDQFFPRVRQRIWRGVSSSIQKLVFDFTNENTNWRPANFQALGKKSLVKAAWDIDRQLAEIHESFDLVLSVTPTNTSAAFEEFKKHNYERIPRFSYRPLSIEPTELKRRLYAVHIDRVEDPAMAQLFSEHQRSLDSRITLLADRDTKRFKYESIQLYGTPTERDVEIARHLLNSLSSKKTGGKVRMVKAEEFAEAARQELHYYHSIDDSFTADVEIRNDIAGVMVSDGNLLISHKAGISENRVDSVLHHEVGTHLLTYHNGEKQRFKQLKAGFVGYDELQEGLAVLAEYLCGGLTRSRLKTLAARVVAVQMMIDGATFIDVYREFTNRFGFQKRSAFKLLMRVYRGGGFTKDAIYLRGLMWLLEYFRSGGDLETLIVGKFPINHIGIIRELIWRGVVKKPALVPRYLHDDSTKGRIDALSSGVGITDLADGIMI